MYNSWQVWAKIERAAGDEDRAKELIRASVNLKGAGAAALNAGAKFMERTVGGNRAARKLYDRVLAIDPGYAPSLQAWPHPPPPPPFAHTDQCNIYSNHPPLLFIFSLLVLECVVRRHVSNWGGVLISIEHPVPHIYLLCLGDGFRHWE